MIVLVGGRAGEGKTTFSWFCQGYLETRKQESVVFSFASSVKDVAYDSFSWDGNKDQRGRRLLQGIGFIGREYIPSIWADKLADKIIETWEEGKSPIIFVDDWRFPNECLSLESQFHPIIKVRIKRPKEFHTLLGTELYNDSSETSLPDNEDYYDYIFYNDATLPRLKERAKAFCEHLIYKKKE